MLWCTQPLKLDKAPPELRNPAQAQQKANNHNKQIDLNVQNWCSFPLRDSTQQVYFIET